jgi:hypothetical protein
MTIPTIRTALAAFAALAASALPCIAAEEQPQCPPGDGYVDCMAKSGDKMAVYVQGRDAYDSARQSHDYTQALRIARALDQTRDKNGERLLKMVHLQLGWGAHQDPVQAYVWLSEDLAAGKDYITPLRRGLVEKMSPDQLRMAKEQVHE